MADHSDPHSSLRFHKYWAPTLSSAVGMLLGGLCSAGLGMLMDNEIMVTILAANGMVAGSFVGYLLGRKL